MADQISPKRVNTEKRQEMIRTFPCFAQLNSQQCNELAKLMQEVNIEINQRIVSEDELVDSVYLIVHGKAEVTREVQHRKKRKQVPVAVLTEGESIGLSDTGFYSTTGKRTATVTAMTNLLLLRLDVKDLYFFLKQHHLELSMTAASAQMLRMRLIKQSLPFAKISHERLQWLAERVEELEVPAGRVIFNQGEIGDRCYLIRKGQVEIIYREPNGEEKQIALLKPPVLFGEATLITHSTRNATAKAAEDCELLVLRHEFLSELIESEDNVASMFMTLMVDRSRPVQNPEVSVHHRTSADGQEIIILKNPDNHHYFKLSQEGFFIWSQLNGKHTLQDITLSMAEQCQVFAPDVVVALISKLTRAGFIHEVEITEAALKKQPIWIKIMVSLQRLMDKRIAFGDADAWMSRIYERYVHYFFTRAGLWILGIIILLGLAAFFSSTRQVIHFFSHSHISILLVLALIPFSMLELVLHEFGHAFAVKACGREVHYIGMGWTFSGPIAFSDTSDMWLAARKPRMMVNMAGVYVDLLVAGLSALMIWAIPYPLIQGMLWLFALYTYISAFRMLTPLQEMDGYYVLMDWVEKNHLRHSAVLWLVKKFPKSIRHPSLFLENKPELIYWLSGLIYLALVTLLTLAVQRFVFIVCGIHLTNRYVSLILPFFVVLFSSLSIIAEIRSQVEE